MAVETAERTTPPDVRGPTAPLPLAVLVIGMASLALVILGSIGTEVARAMGGQPVTAACRAEGLIPFQPSPNPAFEKGIRGARGVCNIVTAAPTP